MNPTIKIIQADRTVTIVLTHDRRAVSIIRPRAEFYLNELACDCFTDFIQPRWALVPGTTPDGGTGPYEVNWSLRHFSLIDTQDSEPVLTVPIPGHDFSAVQAFCMAVGGTHFQTEKPNEIKYGGFQSFA